MIISECKLAMSNIMRIEYTRGYRLALVTSVVTAGDLRLAKEASPPARGYIANRARYHNGNTRGIPGSAPSIKLNQTTRLQRDFARGRPLTRIAIVIQRKWYIGFITSIHCVPSGRKNLLKAGVIYAAFRIFTQRKPNHRELLTRAAEKGWCISRRRYKSQW
jgi:hypothetical protein